MQIITTKTYGQYKIHEVLCKQALHKVKGQFPYSWDFNAYRGCQHGCQYCYALYSHAYLNAQNYFKEYYVKTNIVEQLERQLAAKSWQHQMINLGSVTDHYQPLEKNYQLMPEIWRLLIRYQNPVAISTKSDLILRDYDLIAKLASLTYVNIAATITTMDESLRQKLEPQTASSRKRFAMLKAFRHTNAVIGVHIMPVIPYLTDSTENLAAIFQASTAIDAHYILPGLLHLRGQTKVHFFEFLRHHYPQQVGKLLQLYQTGSLDQNYKKEYRQQILALRQTYQQWDTYQTVLAKRFPKQPLSEQLSLF